MVNEQTQKECIFLKLGGSLITEKDRAQTARYDRLRQAAEEIVEAYQTHPNLELIIGHGSGSFGHIAARKHHTRSGVDTQAEWLGFAEVWQDARKLNQIVIEVFREHQLPVIAFPASASVISRRRVVQTWNLEALLAALEHRLIPIVYGDVVFDLDLGGTILSTEEIFIHLSSILSPDRILLAGIEEGVWADFPKNTRVIPSITADNFETVRGMIQGSASPDVTGGMIQKVSTMLSLVKQNPAMEISIFSGIQKGNLSRALSGENCGTRIHYPEQRKN
ncbi:MAG: isopentenyl phosphate kinase family protein [Anaerolineaceae bacterium]|nr:isopentenyl phosphate kinase family protein [Anaerolineaceae bacterium]